MTCSGASTLRQSRHSPQHPSTLGERCTMARPAFPGHFSPFRSTSSHSRVCFFRRVFSDASATGADERLGDVPGPPPEPVARERNGQRRTFGQNLRARTEVRAHHAQRHVVHVVLGTQRFAKQAHRHNRRRRVRDGAVLVHDRPYVPLERDDGVPRARRLHLRVFQQRSCQAERRDVLGDGGGDARRMTRASNARTSPRTCTSPSTVSSASASPPASSAARSAARDASSTYATRVEGSWTDRQASVHAGEGAVEVAGAVATETSVAARAGKGRAALRRAARARRATRDVDGVAAMRDVRALMSSRVGCGAAPRSRRKAKESCRPVDVDKTADLPDRGVQNCFISGTPFGSRAVSAGDANARFFCLSRRRSRLSPHVCAEGPYATYDP